MRSENEKETAMVRPMEPTSGQREGPMEKPGFSRYSKASADQHPPRSPALRFSPTAWAKLLSLRDLGDSEVGGFGVAAAEDLLLVEDVKLVRQTCTGASVAFDDASVADFFDEQVDRGLRPERFDRIWVHTHPGNWADPIGPGLGHRPGRGRHPHHLAVRGWPTNPSQPQTPKKENPCVSIPPQGQRPGRT